MNMAAASLRRFVRGFAYAGKGLLVLVSTQRNFRFHLLAATFVVAAGVYFRVAAWEWAALLICIFWVLGMEALNSAMEFLADRVSAEHDPLIARSKDTAAAAVLLSAIGAALVGLIVFLPHLGHGAWS